MFSWATTFFPVLRIKPYQKKHLNKETATAGKVTALCSFIGLCFILLVKTSTLRLGSDTSSGVFCSKQERINFWSRTLSSKQKMLFLRGYWNLDFKWIHTEFKATELKASLPSWLFETFPVHWDSFRHFQQGRLQQKSTKATINQLKVALVTQKHHVFWQ